MVQVNQWLTWLETAEEEESEDEDYWGTGQSHVLSGCNERFIFYFIQFSFFFLSSSCPSLNSSPLVVFIPSNHCYNSFRYMFNQIKPASLPSYCIYAFLSWFSTSDVLQQMVFNTFQSSWVMFFFLTVGNVQETTSTWTWPFITFYIWSVTKCCYNY